MPSNTFAPRMTHSVSMCSFASSTSTNAPSIQTNFPCWLAVFLSNTCATPLEGLYMPCRCPTRTPSGASAPATHARVEPVTKGVAQEVRCEYGEEEEDAARNGDRR